MSYQDSDFVIHGGKVYWAPQYPKRTILLQQAGVDDIHTLQGVGYVGRGNPALYLVATQIMSADIIQIYDSKGNLLHAMEDKNGVHRGTDQEVHGSATGSSSGSQPTGTSIASTTTGGFPLLSGWPQYAGLGSGYSIGTLQGTSQITYQQALAAAQYVPQVGYIQNYGYGYTVIPTSAAVPTTKVDFEPKKKIKDEGIRVGEIIAYRCWPIKNGFLWSTAADRAWAPGEPMKAGENHIRDGLGIYAFKDMSRCIHEFGGESFYRCGVAYGSVVLWGEIVEHQLGYRAEYAAVRSIEFVRNVDAQFWRPESVADLRALYKVEGK